MKKYILLFYIAIFSEDIFAQKNNPIEISGYTNEMFSLFTENLDNSWHWQNLVHNRLNLGWQPHAYWRIDIGIRNRLFNGDFKYSRVHQTIGPRPRSCRSILEFIRQGGHPLEYDM